MAMCLAACNIILPAGVLCVWVCQAVCHQPMLVWLCRDIGHLCVQILQQQSSRLIIKHNIYTLNNKVKPASTMKNTTGTPVKTVCWPLDSCSCCLCGCVRMLLTTASDVSQNCPIDSPKNIYENCQTGWVRILHKCPCRAYSLCLLV